MYQESRQLHRSRKRKEREHIFVMGSGGHRPQIEIAIDGQTVKTLIDSGAQVNLIDQSTYDSLSTKPRLETCGGKLYAYQTDKPIPIKGQFQASVEANGHKTEARFKVVEGQAGNLLSFFFFSYFLTHFLIT